MISFNPSLNARDFFGRYLNMVGAAPSCNSSSVRPCTTPMAFSRYCGTSGLRAAAVGGIWGACPFVPGAWGPTKCFPWSSCRRSQSMGFFLRAMTTPTPAMSDILPHSLLLPEHTSIPNPRAIAVFVIPISAHCFHVWCFNMCCRRSNTGPLHHVGDPCALTVARAAPRTMGNDILSVW